MRSQALQRAALTRLRKGGTEAGNAPADDLALNATNRFGGAIERASRHTHAGSDGANAEALLSKMESLARSRLEAHISASSRAEDLDAEGLAGASLMVANISAKVTGRIDRPRQRLETEVGVPFVERSPQGVRLTEEGRLLLPHARRILATVEQAQDAVDGIAASPKGTLRVNAAITFAVGTIAPMLPPFVAGNPDIRVVL